MPLNKTLRNVRATFGDNGQNGKKNIMSVSFISQDLGRPKASSTTAIAPATAVSGSVATLLPINSQPDVPRSVTLTFGGTATDIKAAAATITGTNSEGKVITETITPVVDTAGTTGGVKAFATVTSISIPAQDGNGVTVSAGYGTVLGFSHRALSTTVVKLYKRTIGGTESLVDPALTAFSASNIENNTVRLDVNPDGNNAYRVYAYFVNWHLNPINGEPTYGA